MQGIVLDSEQKLIAIYLNELKLITTPLDGLERQRANLGKKLFFDKNLSRGKTLSCASCHDPLHAFIDARFATNPVDGSLSVGDDGTTLGGRNAPTVMYAKIAPAFFTMDDGTQLKSLKPSMGKRFSMIIIKRMMPLQEVLQSLKKQ